jgi:CO/xanthine dehydrogenase Mo-binding subunit
LGEPPIIPLTAAVANAVADAIGVRVTDLPLTPDRILNALRAGKETAQ